MRETDIQTLRQKTGGSETDIQALRLTGRQVGVREADIQALRQTDRQRGGSETDRRREDSALSNKEVEAITVKHGVEKEKGERDGGGGRIGGVRSGRGHRCLLVM